jgi:ATP-dependent DNA helicase RecG
MPRRERKVENFLSDHSGDRPSAGYPVFPLTLSPADRLTHSHSRLRALVVNFKFEIFRASFILPSGMTRDSQNPSRDLSTPITQLRGVGAERAAQLARLEIFTAHDLLLHRPRRYEDRRYARKIAQLALGESFATRGIIVAQGLKRYRGGSRSIFEIILDDGTARLHCRWWNLPFMEKYFQPGDDVLVFGKVLQLKPRTIDHPETEVLEPGEEPSIHIDRIAPIYPLTEGLPQRWLRSLIWRTLEEFESAIVEPHPEIPLEGTPSGAPPLIPSRAAAAQREMLSEIVPANRMPLLARARAIRLLHFPQAESDSELARERLALDEFIELQKTIQLRRKKMESRARGLPCSGTNELIKIFLARLGFRLTDAQTKVLREIRHDMGGAHPMRRLLQGDVGSGKTVVAACTALMALESRFNVALMAPTEILAEQHFLQFQKWFGSIGVTVELLTGATKTWSKDQPSLESAQPASATLFIGTHALLEESFAPDRLGLVIIDEQHKFGVAQREKFLRKGIYPHLLVMTATPIPRTLGLTLYGDLDISVITKLPPGRGQVATVVRTEDKLPKVWEFVREKISEGRQAYVVYPRVEDVGGGDLKAVTKEFDNLKKVLAPHHVAMLHGRVKPAEKETVMAGFRANQIHVLLATSVIEVGIDVPNATVMVIENADRFGLAQLHQLRGRIGRGAHQSFCILLASPQSTEGRRRLQILAETNDGFRIAEEDLKWRGPGELAGQQQSGLARLRFGDLIEDGDLVLRARQLVKESLK